MRLLLPDDDAEAAEVNTAPAERVLALVAGLPRHPRIAAFADQAACAPRRRNCVRGSCYCFVRSAMHQWAERMLTEMIRRFGRSAVREHLGTDTPSARRFFGKARATRTSSLWPRWSDASARLRGVAAPLEEMVRHPSAHCRAAAAGAMGRARDGHFVPWLNSFVKDPDAVVRGPRCARW